MDKEMLEAISKLLDEKLTPIRKDIEKLKVDYSDDLLHKISKDVDYMSGYYYNRTQKM